MIAFLLCRSQRSPGGLGGRRAWIWSDGWIGQERLFLEKFLDEKTVKCLKIQNAKLADFVFDLFEANLGEPREEEFVFSPKIIRSKRTRELLMVSHELKSTFQSLNAFSLTNAVFILKFLRFE